MTSHLDLPSRPIGFWLVPGPTDHAHLSHLIDALAVAFDAARFEPHITLHVGDRTEADDVESLLARFAESCAPIRLAARATGHTATLFKTLFIEFEPDQRLHDLHMALRLGLRRKADYTLQPHLSLLYKELPLSKRQELATRHEFCGDSILFDHIAAVRPGGSDDHWMDVRGWDPWLRAPLRG